MTSSGRSPASHPACREWSTRRSQITEALAARGLDPDTASGRAAQNPALATRQRKVRVGDGRPLHGQFIHEAITAGHDPSDVLEATLGSHLQRRRQQHTPPIEPSPRLLDALTGPDGVTKSSSAATTDSPNPTATTMTLRNGMTGRVTATRRRGITVDLHAAHRTPGGPRLPNAPTSPSPADA